MRCYVWNEMLRFECRLYRSESTNKICMFLNNANEPDSSNRRKSPWAETIFRWKLASSSPTAAEEIESSGGGVARLFYNDWPQKNVNKKKTSEHKETKNRGRRAMAERGKSAAARASALVRGGWESPRALKFFVSQACNPLGCVRPG